MWLGVSGRKFLIDGVMSLKIFLAGFCGGSNVFFSNLDVICLK